MTEIIKQSHARLLVLSAMCVFTMNDFNCTVVVVLIYYIVSPLTNKHNLFVSVKLAVLLLFKCLLVYVVLLLLIIININYVVLATFNCTVSFQPFVVACITCITLMT